MSKLQNVKDKMNIFTVDLEDWYHLLYKGIARPINQWDNQISILERNTDIILNLLKQYNAQATFFVLGWIAEKNPMLIQKIAQYGHEIASHGYSHRMIGELTKEEFNDDLYKAKKFIYQACRKNPIGYRAPGFSITKKTSWALDIIKREGYLYDSSIFYSNLRYFDIKTKYNSHLNNGFYELSINNNNILSINILGGVIFRAIPQKALYAIISRNNRIGIPSVLVIHPRELDAKQPRLNMGIIKNIKTYYGLNHCVINIKFLLQHFKWISAETFFKRK